MLKIGITGKNGFIGSHLSNTLNLYPLEFEVVDFDRTYFYNDDLLDVFVRKCDVIVHLAALNRHHDPQEIYHVNTDLVNRLVGSFERTNHKPHVIISSSTQEERENSYGKSKKESREKFSAWSKKSGATFTGMIIPNVFGPFGEPKYNSVVATFCHQITRNETPHIENNGQLKLIYVGELVQEILDVIRKKKDLHVYQVSHTSEALVSELLEILVGFKNDYQDLGVIPELHNSFLHQLFNTFRAYIDHKNFFPRKFVVNSDERGAFIELIRLGIGGQVSYSTTVPGITRGNHYHTRKIERFSVIKGKALIQLRKIDTQEVMDFYLDGDEPAYVDMPIWYTHNIKNVGDDELLTVFWINEHYDPNNPDTYFENV